MVPILNGVEIKNVKCNAMFLDEDNGSFAIITDDTFTPTQSGNSIVRSIWLPETILQK